MAQEATAPRPSRALRLPEHPFWPVTLVAAAFILFNVVWLAFIYLQRPQMQTLALVSISGLLLAAHGGIMAWARNGRYRTGIWLLTSVQSLAAIATALFTSDYYWILGGVMLLAVPLGVALVDHPKRLPLFIVSGLCAAGLMVGFDLLNPFGNIALFSLSPAFFSAVVAFLLLATGLLVGLLVYYRLRPGASERIRLDLTTQQSLAFTGVAAFSTLLVTGVLMTQLRRTQVTQVGRNFQTVAEINAERVGNSLDTVLSELASFGRRSNVLLRGLTDANAAYGETRAEIQERLERFDSQWRGAAEGDPFVLGHRSNQQAFELSRFRGTNLLYENMILTDRFGGLVAAQGRMPSQYNYSNEAWWQRTWNFSQGDVYVGNLQIDPHTGVATIFLAVTVFDPQTNQSLGVLVSEYHLRDVRNFIETATARTQGKIHLIDAEGLIIVGSEGILPGERASVTPEAGLSDSVWALKADRQNTPVIAAYAPLRTTANTRLSLLQSLGWQVFVSDSQERALSGVTRSMKVTALVGLIVMALVVLAATLMARLLTKPIEALTRTAAAMGEGDLEKQARPVGPVELVTLAESFNALSARLRLLIHNLQDQVERRTAELFEATEEAEAARAEAEAANEAKSAFLSSVSHELRTPLTSVLGFARIIQKRFDEVILPKLDVSDRKTERAVKQVRENIDIILTEGERLTALINDVLDLAKIESGKMDWDMQPLDITEVIDRALSATSALYEAKGLQVTRRVEADLPEVTADRNRMIQVLINLISNAVKFTDKGRVVCRARRVGSSVIVSVQDSGIGIAPEDQPKVFEKFKQVGDTLTDKPQGTGLGLPICKEIVEYHGGEIWVESSVGQGSIFSFSLPVPETKTNLVKIDTLLAELRAHVKSEREEEATLTPKTILVVDDESSIRSLLRQQLEAEGYIVREASDGADAIAEVERARPNLILMDVMMPRINGYDVAAALKNDPRTLDIPIILVSVMEDKERGFRAGADRYFTKPIHTESLLGEIETLLLSGTRKRVMVIDDDAEVSRDLAHALGERGYDVSSTRADEGLLERIRSFNPDMLIVNAILGDEDSTLQAIRSERGLENVFILMYR